MLQTLYHIGSKKFVVAVLSCNRFPFYLLKMDSEIIITNDKKKSFISDDSGVRYFYWWDSSPWHFRLPTRFFFKVGNCPPCFRHFRIYIVA